MFDNPKKEITNRLLKGVAAQGFSQAVQIFIRIAEVPLLLTFWGAPLYGEWLIISAIPVYLSICDGGFSEVACHEIAMKSSTGDKTGSLVVFQSTWLLLIFFSFLTFLAALGFTAIMPLENLPCFSSIKKPEIEIVFFLLIGHVLLGFQSRLLKSGFWVSGCYPFFMYLQAIMQILEFCGLAIAVILNGGPVQAALGYFCGRSIGIGIILLNQRNVSPWLKFGLSFASFPDIRRLVIPSLSSLVFPLSSVLNIQGTRLAVGFTLGPSSVALFVPLRTLSRLVMQPATIINRLIEPEMAITYGDGNKILFQRIFTKSCQIAFWGCLGAIIFVSPAAHWIFPAWTGGKFTMHWLVFLLLIGGALINSIWSTALMVPYATNLHGKISLSYLFIYGVAGLGLSFFGAFQFGLPGVAFFLLAIESVMGLIILNNALKMTDIRLTSWIGIIISPPSEILSKAARLLKAQKNEIA